MQTGDFQDFCYSLRDDVGGLTMLAAVETLPAPCLAPRLPAPARNPTGKHTVHWFRKGLRLHDNPALREGLVDAATFRCVFIIDPWFASSSNVGINKWRFLLQCLEDLDSSLKKLNSRLFVVRGQPADALPKLFREWGTTALTFEEDPEPYGRVRDHNIMTKCREVGISVTSRVSHTLYKLDNIIERNGGKAPLTYHQFQALIASMPPPPPAEVTITVQTLNGAVTPISDDHDDRFGVPSLEELGFETEGLKPPVWVGGENEGLLRLERHLERKAWVASFGRPKMTPQSLLASQTGLSPYLRFGCLSTRLFYYQLTELYKRVKHVRPPLSLHGQILWREFFYCAATKNPNFDRMEGNPICVQIPWEKNQDALAKWASAKTGFPWIDAIMIQLREEGWIHHLARHAVACFLTRGDLFISWEEGMKVFDELLLDADWSVNAGMWMWLSCSSFFQQFFHCYCPVRFGRKTDPNGDFIRKYIPALKNMPTRYIHEPWQAPAAVQEAARCHVGRDYPMPIVDHHKASQANIERIKLVYTQLAKFKPAGSLNPQIVQRPNVMQSSPSPTSIIVNINQSNYLCSQTPDPPQPTPEFKEDYVFLKPTRNNRIKADPNKQTPFKQIVIVQQDQKPSVQRQPPAEVSYISNNIQCPVKSESYDFKQLVINNSTPNERDIIFVNKTTDEQEVYRQNVDLDEYTTSKPKLYFIDNGVTTHNDNAQKFSPQSYINDYNTKEKSQQNVDDTVHVHNMEVDKDHTKADDKTTSDANK
ncbi:cryptochrome-1-like isoform X2 [Maniola hyperantus]|uniref:cryptochrome-1-like isoform X2 n=1 Tax=Aphantopus hyperantus TaxID=2795564 RepID=UPI00213E3308